MAKKYDISKMDDDVVGIINIYPNKDSNDFAMIRLSEDLLNHIQSERVVFNKIKLTINEAGFDDGKSHKLTKNGNTKFFQIKAVNRDELVGDYEVYLEDGIYKLYKIA